MAVEAYCVPRDKTGEMWPAVADFVERAYKSADEIVPPDILDLMRSGHRQLWIVWDGEKVLGTAVTRINVQRSGLACQIAACGGTDGDQWIHLISRIEDWAKAEGCRRVIVEGRDGWERKLPGYKRIRVVIAREL